MLPFPQHYLSPLLCVSAGSWADDGTANLLGSGRPFRPWPAPTSRGGSHQQFVSSHDAHVPGATVNRRPWTGSCSEVQRTGKLVCRADPTAHPGLDTDKHSAAFSVTVVYFIKYLLFINTVIFPSHLLHLLMQRAGTAILENVSVDGSELPGCQGRLQNPGKCSTACWPRWLWAKSVPVETDITLLSSP